MHTDTAFSANLSLCKDWLQVHATWMHISGFTGTNEQMHLQLDLLLEQTSSHQGCTSANRQGLRKGRLRHPRARRRWTTIVHYPSTVRRCLCHQSRLCADPRNAQTAGISVSNDIQPAGTTWASWSHRSFSLSRASLGLVHFIVSAWTTSTPLVCCASNTDLLRTDNIASTWYNSSGTTLLLHPLQVHPRRVLLPRIARHSHQRSMSIW